MIEFILADVVFFFICCVLAKYEVIEMEMWAPKWLTDTVQDLPDGRTEWLQ